MTDALPLSAVVAVGRNGAIGLDNALPWTMPSDLARFRALTMGKPMIMGRRTFESIGKALPGRVSMVVSRRGGPNLPDGVLSASSLAEAVDMAATQAVALGASEIAVIGGAALFDALMPRLDRVYLTVIDLRPEADTFLESLDPYVWRETERLRPPRHPRDDADCVFLAYRRA